MADLRGFMASLDHSLERPFVDGCGVFVGAGCLRGVERRVCNTAVMEPTILSTNPVGDPLLEATRQYEEYVRLAGLAHSVSHENDLPHYYAPLPAPMTLSSL